MPRKRKAAADFTPGDFFMDANAGQASSSFTGPSHDQLPIPNTAGVTIEDDDDDDDDNEPGFYNVCPCSKCAEKMKPSVRLMTTIERHIQKHKIAKTYEVRMIRDSFPHYIRVHSVTWDNFVLVANSCRGHVLGKNCTKIMIP
jgi:hypothetical protein